MAIDRTTILRNAEKLLRQGKVDLAIADYLRIVEDQPRDWNSANVLGDLYQRTGQTGKAVEQFIRIADSLNEEGFVSKAGALYKKVLKIQPDHEHALIQGAELSASQGLLADARSYLNTVADRRRGRGDQRGAAEIRIRLGTLDPADFEARANGARARAEVGDAKGALRDLKEIAAELTAKGREADAIEVLREAAILSPDDDEIRERLLAVYITSGDFARARECAGTADQFKALAGALEAAGHAAHALDALREARRLDPEDEAVRQQLLAMSLAAGDFEGARECADSADQFKALAATLDAAGHPDRALDALREAARRDPADAALKTHLARAFVARGDLAAAAEHLTVESAGGDPHLLLTVAEIQLRAGGIDDGVAILRRLLDEDPSRRESIALLGWNLAEQAPEAAFRAVELAADVAVAQSDWLDAAANLQEFVTRVANHIPALMRLVEICVDGGLEAAMYGAQAQLADAYITVGAAAEARYIAEDLVAREPWEKANIERFRRALVLTGEPDPDAVIAERLSGQSPFTSTDLSLGDLGGFDEPASASAPPRAASGSAPARAPEPAVPASRSAGPAPTPAGNSRAKREETPHFQLSSNAIDLDSILGGDRVEGLAPDHDDAVEGAEVDLSVDLDDIDSAPEGRGAPAEPAAASAARKGGADPDAVFEQLRYKASKQMDAADAEYRRGLALRDAGQIDEAIEALRAASRAPRLRFQTASLLGRIYRERQAFPQAVEWFERAAEAPAPTTGDGHLLLYDLAGTLESVGETARALVICLELQADAGDYKDIAERVDRLAKVQTRG